MKTIIQHALKNIKYFKAKSIVSALVCFVCAAFFTYEAQSLISFKAENDEALDNTFGVHDGILGCNSDTLSRVKNDPTFTDTGTISVLFHGVRCESFADRKIVIGTADKNAVELQRIRLSEGRFPENESELALERTLADILFPGVKIGDKINVEITLPAPHVREYTLCGILSDFSNLQWDPSEKSVPMANALTGGSCETALYNLVSVVGEAGKYADEGVYFPNQRDNYDTLKAISGVSSDVSAVIIAAGFALFTLASMIAFAYALSRGSGKATGLMKTAGFTNGAVSLFFAVRSALLFVPSAVIGASVGAIISGKMPKGAFFTAAVCSAAVIVVLLSATVLFSRRECHRTVMENLSQSPDENYTQNIRFTSENPVILYSIKNFLLNGKETAVPCVMVFLSSLLLFITLSVSAKMDTELKQMQRPYDVSLSFADKTLTTVNVSRYPQDGLSDEEFNALRSHECVKYALGCKRLYVHELFEDMPYSDNERGETYEADKERLGFPDCALSEHRMCGLDDNSLELLRGYVVEGKTDIDDLCGGNNAVWLRGGGPEHSVGDVIKLAYVINQNPEHPTLDDLAYHEIEVTISAVADLPKDGTDETARMLRECLSGSLVWPEKAFEQIGVENHYDSVFLKTADDYGPLFTLIEDLKMYYGERFIISDRLGERKSFESFRNAFFSIACILTGGLSAFSVVSLSLITAAKYAVRKRLFGFLRAAGLTKKQMRTLIILENLPAVFAAFALGIICGAITALIMGIPLSGFAALLIAALLYFAAITLIAVFAVKRNFRFSVVDCVRCE